MKKFSLIIISLVLSLVANATDSGVGVSGKIADVVDLGLSVKWASWNVGADKPEGLGNLYAWGELSSKTNYSASTYKFYNGSYTKYGSVDNKYKLDSEDDVAKQNWGGKWRMPTFEELKELKENCTFTKTELNGVPVTKVTGPNGNFIYFPYPGNFTGTSLYYKNSIGSYWSSDLKSDSYAQDLDFIGGKPDLNEDSRYHGQSVRPVYVESGDVPHTDNNGTVPDVVDLGLSSGTLWAAWNIGASVPEEYGLYFAWGETAPKSNYAWSTYKFGNGSNFSKYNSTDGLTELELEDDAAYVILGKDWRMPTHEEELELVNECSWESVTVNGISGYKITGPNGNSIFMPRGGLYDGTDYSYEGTKLSNVNSCGWYWSSTLNAKGSAYAQGLCFYPSLLTNVCDHERSDGHNIRPVYVGGVNSEISIITKIFDANSQPMLVGGFVENYSDQNVIKKGIIVSKSVDDMIITDDTVFDNATIFLQGKSSSRINNPYDIRFIDCTGTNEEQFACALQFLVGNTDYYVKAFVIDKDNNVLYGSTEKVHTQDFNRYDGWADYANVWHAFEYTLFDVVTDEIINPNEGFYYTTNENPLSVRYQTGTSYNTCYKLATEWNYKLWYSQWYHRTLENNSSKVVHLPVMRYNGGLLTIEKNPLDADKDITIYYSINGNYFRPETYTDVYTAPIDMSEPCTVYCYAISSDGYISYTNMYVVGDYQIDSAPIVDKDIIEVGNVAASKGSTISININLINESTNLTAYQFDLILPAGVTLATNANGKYQVTKTSRYVDDNQTLNVSKVEGSYNTYRIVCFSMSNEKIADTSGAILNAALTIGESVNEGSYEATISNIVVTKTDGTQLKLSDAKFNIVVTNVIKGDANGDGEVNVSDIVEIVNYIMNKPSDKFVFAAADLNEDGEVNVTDIVKVVSIIMSSSNNAPKRAAVAEMVDNDQLEMTSKDSKTLSLNLQNEGSYVASQFDIVLSAGQTLEGIQLNSKRMENHQMTYTKTGDNRYKVVIYSLNNAAYKGQSGELLNIKVAGSGDVSVEDILFVTAGQMEKNFPPLRRGTTGISLTMNEAETMDIYSIDGRLIRKQAKSTDGLEKGLYIINGKKQIIR